MTEASKSGATGEAELLTGLPETLREAAAGLYWDAFERKLGVVIGPRRRGVSVLESALDPERVVDAVASGGLAGFHLGDSSFVGVRIRHVVSEFGYPPGLPTLRTFRAAQGRGGQELAGLQDGLGRNVLLRKRISPPVVVVFGVIRLAQWGRRRGISTPHNWSRTRETSPTTA